MIVIEKDIVESDETEVIIHQVNCQNKMGSGVAKAIYTKYPEVKSKYHEFCYDKLPEELIGDAQLVNCNNGVRQVINLFGQLNYGRDGRQYTSYDAVKSALEDVAEFYKGQQVTFAIPYGIGSGLGGGDFTKINEIIEDTLKGFMFKYYRK